MFAAQSALLLRPDQLNQRANDPIQLVTELLILPDVAEHHGNLETRQRLARRAQRGVVARVSVLPTAVHALPEVERDG